jgi:hypothetical protein
MLQGKTMMSCTRKTPRLGIADYRDTLIADIILWQQHHQRVGIHQTIEFLLPDGACAPSAPFSCLWVGPSYDQGFSRP